MNAFRRYIISSGHQYYRGLFTKHINNLKKKSAVENTVFVIIIYSTLSMSSIMAYVQIRKD